MAKSKERTVFREILLSFDDDGNLSGAHYRKCHITERDGRPPLREDTDAIPLAVAAGQGDVNGDWKAIQEALGESNAAIVVQCDLQNTALKIQQAEIDKLANEVVEKDKLLRDYAVDREKRKQLARETADAERLAAAPKAATPKRKTKAK